jgi:hypothetical protein
MWIQGSDGSVDVESRAGLPGEARVSSFLFVTMTVVLTAGAAWFFGSGLGRDKQVRDRQLTGSGRRSEP